MKAMGATGFGASERLADDESETRAVAIRVLDDIYRVMRGERIVGYVQLVGRVYVSLEGPVYNTSCEIGQALDLESAVRRFEG